MATRSCFLCATTIEAFEDEKARKDHIKHYHKITNPAVLVENREDGPMLVYELYLFDRFSDRGDAT